MLDGMTQEDKDDSVIVIFIGEVQCYNISHYHQYMYQFSSIVSKLNEDHSGFRKWYVKHGETIQHALTNNVIMFYFYMWVVY